MKEFTLLKIYLAIVSVVAVIGTFVGYGNLAYSYLKAQIITDQEYITGGNFYDISQCENGVYAPEKNTTVPRSAADIATCKTDTEKRLIDKRHYDYKDSMISGGVWGTVFLILFFTHFPMFIRRYKEKA